MVLILSSGRPSASAVGASHSAAPVPQRPASRWRRSHSVTALPSQSPVPVILAAVPKRESILNASRHWLRLIGDSRLFGQGLDRRGEGSVLVISEAQGSQRADPNFVKPRCLIFRAIGSKHAQLPGIG